MDGVLFQRFLFHRQHDHVERFHWTVSLQLSKDKIRSDWFSPFVKRWKNVVFHQEHYSSTAPEDERHATIKLRELDHSQIPQLQRV